MQNLYFSQQDYSAHKKKRLSYSTWVSVLSVPQQVREVWCRKVGPENLESWIWKHLPHFHHLRKFCWITSVYTFSPSFTTAWLELNPLFQMALRPGCTWTLVCLKKTVLCQSCSPLRSGYYLETIGKYSRLNNKHLKISINNLWNLSFLPYLGNETLQMQLRIFRWDYSPLCWWALNAITRVPIRERQKEVKGTHRREGMWRRNRERHGHKAKECQHLPEAGRGKGWVLS